MLVVYDVDCNTILAHSIKSKKLAEMNVAFVSITNVLTKKGFKPFFWMLDNEIF